MKDKGIIHCIVIALMIWNFVFNLEQFSTMFKFRISIKKLQELSRMLGAVQMKDNKGCYALKLPLPVAISRIPLKRKKMNR